MADGRWQKEEGRRKKEEGRRKKEEGRIRRVAGNAVGVGDRGLFLARFQPLGS
jgi:hypothetical protein